MSTTYVRNANCDIFSSTSTLESLMHLERHMVAAMSEYVINVEHRLGEIKHYLEEFSQTAGRPEYHNLFVTEDIIGNPLQAFQLIKQVEELEEKYNSLIPSDEDLNGAALALVRLQDTYNLNITDLAEGKLLGQHTYIAMNARDCLFLGKHAFNNGYYGLAVEWMQEALVRAHREGNITASVDEISTFYQMALEIEVAANADLKCYITNRGHPWLILQPVKVEVLHKDPYIAVFHDLITDNEIEKVKEIAAPFLERAKVQNEVKRGSEVSDVRTSQTAWFSNEDYEITRALSRRIEAVTGLSTNMDNGDAELQQVANYGMGGHYTPHYDYLLKDMSEEERTYASEQERQAGDRIATLMFYLSDVKKGGSTVFTRLGVTITPIKGSAAFWWNLRRNGEGIIDTMHGACPVLMGEKWGVCP
ncbi:vacuolar protein sorting-associated protein 33A-like protein [Dinothrombium tinctorium]|uniref:procollagen-proline 4-dioxygenase n=1 Tax=Dinothrombium tinctorium TaxID=1965070 RepID=A0A443R3J4_9ACAR|nr:vacuolar protein sorting-associated protein 33A-like protein [Dinothrombium tinctorium]